MRKDSPSRATHRTSLAGAAWLGAVHMVIDAVSVTAVLRAAPPKDSIVASALVFVLAYDILAFAGQAPLGWLIDRIDCRRGATLVGVVLAGLGLLVGPLAGYAVVLLASLGNALFHVGAGAMVLAGSQERAAPAGIFVAPGALGLGMGILFGRRFVTVPSWPALFALAAAVAIVLAVAMRTSAAEPSAPPSRLPMHTAVGVALLLFISVGVRSLVGTVGCDACDKTLFLAIALPVAAFAGKLVGGFLADHFGWVDLATVALLASSPLLAFSRGDLWLALPGMLLFQMTMPVTLTAMLRVIPARPAFAFGILCLALIAGAMPAYVPDGWRPQGVTILGLTLGSTAILFVALRALLAKRPARSVATPIESSTVSTYCRGNP